MFPFEPHDDELCRNCGVYLEDWTQEYCSAECEGDHKEGY